MPPTARRIMLRPSRQIEIQTLRKGEATTRQGHLLPLPVAALSRPWQVVGKVETDIRMARINTDFLVLYWQKSVESVQSMCLSWVLQQAARYSKLRELPQLLVANS